MLTSIRGGLGSNTVGRPAAFIVLMFGDTTAPRSCKNAQSTVYSLRGTLLVQTIWRVVKAYAGVTPPKLEKEKRHERLGFNFTLLLELPPVDKKKNRDLSRRFLASILCMIPSSHKIRSLRTNTYRGQQNRFNKFF